MAKVTKIAPKKHDFRKLRVAAYARVSRDSLDQKNSFHSQVVYYTNIISTYPNYIFAGIYADEGITGTTIKGKRTDFERMMFDCRSHKIDRILVKSIQRFSRNTVDCIASLRELKDLGITVLFEKENIDTDIIDGELLITLLGYFSQAESENISKNVRWGFTRNAMNGHYIPTNKTYGYQVVDGCYEIVPEEAEVVKKVFQLCQEGYGYRKIAKTLTELRYPAMDGGSEWKSGAVLNILHNERYTGSIILQKKYTLDDRTFRRWKNNGERPKYELQDTHEAIISEEEFHHVQDLLDRRGAKYKAFHVRNKHYPFTGKLKCAFCQSNFIRHASAKKVKWACGQNLKDSALCHNSAVKEETIEEGFLDALKEYKETMKDVKTEGYAHENNVSHEITLLNKEVIQLKKEKIQGKGESETIDSKIQDLKYQIINKRQYLKTMSKKGEAQVMENCLTDMKNIPQKFDSELFRKLIAKVEIDKTKMTFVFINGQRIERPIYERRKSICKPNRHESS